MQSIATVTVINKAKEKAGYPPKGVDLPKSGILFCRAFGDLLATVVARGADVMAQMNLSGRRLDSQRRIGQKIVRTAHATLGRGLLVLLNGHDYSIFKFTVPCPSDPSERRKGTPFPPAGLLQATYNYRDAAPAEDRE